MSEGTLMRSDLRLADVESVYRGKVRDVYNLHDGRLVMVASDRISACLLYTSRCV